MSTLDGGAVEPAQLMRLATVNYGRFTSMRVENGGVRGLGLHLERLVTDCRRVFDTDLDPDRALACVRKTLDGETRPVLVRVTVFDPALDVADIGADATPSILVTLRAAAPVEGPPLRLATAVYQRESPQVKHAGLFAPMRLRRAARRGGADDVLFTDTDGTVCETSIANVGFVEGDRVLWPRAEWLNGVTMRLVSDAVETVTEPVDRERLTTLDGAFVTNAGVGVRRVGAIDDTRWADRPPLLHRIREAYAGIRPEPL